MKFQVEISTSESKFTKNIINLLKLTKKFINFCLKWDKFVKANNFLKVKLRRMKLYQKC